jgi:hypothetical protein
LLNRRRVPFGMCVTASIVISVLLYFVLAVIILQGSVLMFFNSAATTMQIVKNLLIIIVMCIVCVCITAFLFNDEWRSKWVRRIFRLLNKILFHVFRALIPKGRYDTFVDQLDEGIDLIHKKKKKLTGEGLMAKAFCHEIDHLDGTLFYDKNVIKHLSQEELEEMMG